MKWIHELVCAGLVLGVSAPALAVTSSTSLEGAENGIVAAMPEPSAALLFAAGAVLVSRGLSKRRSR